VRALTSYSIRPSWLRIGLTITIALVVVWLTPPRVIVHCIPEIPPDQCPQPGPFDLSISWRFYGILVLLIVYALVCAVVPPRRRVAAA